MRPHQIGSDQVAPHAKNPAFSILEVPNILHAIRARQLSPDGYLTYLDSLGRRTAMRCAALCWWSSPEPAVENAQQAKIPPHECRICLYIFLPTLCAAHCKQARLILFVWIEECPLYYIHIAVICAQWDVLGKPQQQQSGRTYYYVLCTTVLENRPFLQLARR